MFSDLLKKDGNIKRKKIAHEIVLYADSSKPSAKESSKPVRVKVKYRQQ
jgi:hypothetical protein